MPDVDRYLAKFPPSVFYEHERKAAAAMSTNTTLSRDTMDQGYRELAARKGMTVAEAIERVKRAAGLDGSTHFPSQMAEAVAFSAVYNDEDVAQMPRLSDEEAAEAVAAIVGGNPDLPWDFAKVGKSLSPTSYTDPVPPEVAAQLSGPTAEEEAEALRLSQMDLHGPMIYGSASDGREPAPSDARRIKTVPEFDAEVERLMALSHPLRPRTKKHPQQSKHYAEHDDSDLGTAADSFDVDAEIARYLSQAAEYVNPSKPQSGNVKGKLAGKPRSDAGPGSGSL